MTGWRAAAAATAVAAAASSPAHAEGWNIRDLGHFEDRDACIAKAEQVISWYKATHGSTYTIRLSWTAYGYNLSPGENDVVIICAIDGGGRRALLVVHGESEADRTEVADRLEARWNGGG